MFRGIMVSKRYVSYLRVSTPKQGENGLGVEAQREAVRRYLLSHHGEQIAEFALDGPTRKRRYHCGSTTYSASFQIQS